jgi:glutathione S-transferase
MGCIGGRLLATLARPASKKLADGGDFLAINPKGQVPVPEPGGGQRLTEGPAILQTIADQAPAKHLALAAGKRGATA